MTPLSHAPLDLLDKITTRCQRNIGGKMLTEGVIIDALDRRDPDTQMQSSKR